MIWIDIDDLMRSLVWSVAPTGIQRVQLELLPKLIETSDQHLGFIRIRHNRIESVPENRVKRAVAQFNKNRVVGRRDLALLRVRQALRAAANELRGSGSEPKFSRGDLILNLGASWEHENYAQAISRLKDKHGVRLAVLIHDLLPLSHSQFVAQDHVPNFARWIADLMPILDLVLTPSEATREAVIAYCQDHNLLTPPSFAVRFGDGFETPKQKSSRLDLPSEFVLFVSTVEVRKNHLLLVNVWEKLLQELGPDHVPNLVFAGKRGWNIDPLLSKLKETDNLNGKVIHLDSMSDADLAQAYDRCLFTVFPSFCEGWGLPVSESLAHGKYCVGSNATSVPEVGEDLIDYFDPNDEDAAFQAIRRPIVSSSYLVEKTAKVQEEFRHTRWEDTSRTILGYCQE